MSCVTQSDIDDLKQELTIIIAAIGGVCIGLVVITIVVAIIACTRVKGVSRQLDLIHISLRSIQKDMSRTNNAIERFPKNIVQFPMGKSASNSNHEDDDGTEPASPLFYHRKGYTPTPLASSLTSVTEIPTDNQMVHHPLQRNNAMPHARPKQQGPPVPPKRANSFNNHSFNY